MVIVNRGFAEQVVEKSRQHGATGATILHGRGSAGIGEKFMGMQITPEKETVMIVVNSQIADGVHKELMDLLNTNPNIGGISFILPVTHMTKKTTTDNK